MRFINISALCIGLYVFIQQTCLVNAVFHEQLFHGPVAIKFHCSNIADEKILN
jgi:hypothetical protein